MKNFITLSVGLLLMIVSLGISSCKKEVNPILSNHQTEQDSGKGDDEPMLKTITYYSAPAVGTYTANSSSSTILPGTSGCGDFSGGVIKARVKSQSGSSFVIEIRKQDNTNFSVGGTAYVKVGAVCGTIAQPNTQGVSYSNGQASIEITINATFTQGVVHFYPVIVSSSGGTRYFAEPIMIYTSPMYNIKTSYIIRETLGTVNGTIVKASDWDLTNSNDLDVQCTEFCNRYYSQVYGKDIVDWGTNGNHAKHWYNNAYAKGLTAVAHGSTAPRVGDILCLENGSGNGHVAIIIEVGPSLIKIAQQNAGIAPVGSSNYNTHWQHAIGGGLSYNSSTKIITPPGGYSVEGLLRL